MTMRTWLATTAAMLLVGSQLVHAAVSAAEADKLKSVLTPLGGERAGNKEGTIPAWDGGLTKAVSGAMRGDVPVELFANERPVLQITAKNMAQFADKLSEGTQALLKKYPDSFRLDVYSTHRTAAAPQWVYDNTYKNATRCKTRDAGVTVEGCYGGIPFPIPKDGYEVIWNHLLRVEAEAIEYGFKNVVGTADGSHTLASRADVYMNFPYYYPDGSPEKWSGKYVLNRFTNTAPPFKSGEAMVIHDSINPGEQRQAWQYLVGQRRVRRAPTVGYDTPDFVASGANYFDEVQGFFGPPDRYQWKLVGKREMYIPYNNNGFLAPKVNEAFAKHHANPDKLRWELHRVWVIEATVAPGKRHAVPKRRYYFDEDSWIIVLVDGYDAEGKLWRTSQMPPFVVPKIPAVVMKAAIVFNLQAHTMSAIQLLNEENYRIVPRKPETFYTGEAVASEAKR